MKPDQTDRTYRSGAAVTCGMLLTAPAFLLLGRLDALAWAGAGVFAGILGGRRIRMRLTHDGADVYKRGRWRTVPWSSVTAVRSRRWLASGVVLETSTGPVSSIVPCSWWGGPATPEQVAEIEGWWRRNVELSSQGGT